MKKTNSQNKRIVGLDMHPDVFAAAAIEKTDPVLTSVLWTQDRLETTKLEAWARKNLHSDDIVVLEASGNSFEIAHRLRGEGFTTLVLESCQAGKLRENYCNDDRHSAIKLARVYLSGLAKIVWQPDEQTRQRREVFFSHRNAVRDTTRHRNRIRSFLNEYCVRLPAGTPLTKEQGLKKALSLRNWNPLQEELIKEAFQQLWYSEARRKRLEQIMVAELVREPKWARLWRLMGIRHRVAFALMAMIGDIHRFPTAKKLVGYLGLSPRKVQSGNNAKGKELGIGKTGRGDVRCLLVQSAQNALVQRGSPLHKWGWKLLMRKSRNTAAAAVARKLATAVWYLLKGFFTPLLEMNDHLETKLTKLATVLGKERLRAEGYQDRKSFVQAVFKSLQLVAEGGLCPPKPPGDLSL